MGRRTLRAVLVGAWFAMLSFPFMGVNVHDEQLGISWHWQRVALLGFLVAAVVLFLPPAAALLRNQTRALRATLTGLARRTLADKSVRGGALAALALLLLSLPWLVSDYQIAILTTALLYVMLGLGLNIVVGLAGLLDLGYVAFYAVGAYTYALAYEHWGLGFWSALPAAAMLAALAGIVLGIPVLRLRGDYLAIVTLGFGEIIRLLLENWSDVTNGPMGISGIPKPELPGVELDFTARQTYLYLLVLALVAITLVVVRRLDNSRIGRAWLALREDEIACQAMGIDRSRTKLVAFALGATWAGMAGVLLAAKTSYINPGSFKFDQSALILCIVVLGGMGSVTGVVIAALVLILLPEYLRVFADYRILLFGAALVGMMVFRPEGLVKKSRPQYARPDTS